MADKHFPNGLPRGKMKTLFGLYKILGRDLFLELAKDYCSDVQATVEATLSVMESTWYDEPKKTTLADKMVSDYNEHAGAFTPRKNVIQVTDKVKEEVAFSGS